MEGGVVEEALGSVTQLDVTSSTSSVPLRSSARVSKKKLDSLSKLVLSPTADKRDHDKGDPPEEAEKAPVKKPTIWPMEDKDLFFEAVNEYGKDFAAIQRYFVAKNKNKTSDVRTKEQIRRFYYRTWAKISSKLHFLPHIQKQTQELYGLINYGELRKRMKVRTKKDELRLNELVIRGFTQLRGKNKTINIRTPRCRVLRRICRVEEQQEIETKLPGSIRVELIPADNQTWATVQGLAQNPRVHIHVPLQYRVSSLILYLQRRWLPRHDKYKIKVMEGYEGEVSLTDTKEMLVLRAKPNAEVHLPQINLSHYNSHTKICLSSYEERLGKKGASLEILNKLYLELGTKMKKQKVEVASEKEVKKVDGCELKEEMMSDGDVPKKEEDDVPIMENITIDEEYGLLVAQAVKDECVTTKEDEPKKEAVEAPAAVGAEEADTAPSSTTASTTASATAEDLMARVRDGLTADNCHTLTVGDVYLMVGSDYKLELDYQWRPLVPPDPSVTQLSSMLARLVSLARLTRARCAVQCPCKHQCSESKRPRKDSANEDGPGGQLGLADATFRRPVAQSGNRRVPNVAGRLDAESFRAQMDKLTPKYCNRRGRGIAAKTVVVQRTLPILPKANNGTSVVTLKVIPQTLQLGEFEPVQVVPPVLLPAAPPAPMPPAEPTRMDQNPPPSPTPSISTILDEPFKPFPPPANFAGGGEGVTPPKSPSPSAMLREGWLSEATECSLSSLLSHLETPLKTAHFDATPPDVETHFNYLMTEASLDFTAKFAALAAEVSSESSQ